ncbi:Disease resistance-like protein DSC1 [Linum perenne]
MNSRFSKIEKLLAMEEEPDIVRIVGLWGIGGLGKSTLARTCYERLKRLRRNEMKFHFVDKINETCDKKSSIEELIPKIYSTLLSESNLTREDLNVDYRRERLSRTKIFLVLDDVQTITQLELLFLGTNGNLIKKMFYKGSRIIITTRNNRVLEYLNAETYHVEHLTNDEPLQLFKLHAFIHDDGSSSIPYHLLNLSHIVISYCEGNPLALKVLGGTLFRKDKTYWESFIRSWSEIHQPGIDDVLRRSYDELEDDNKSLFLDIACFFYGISKSLLIKYMETSYTGSYRRIEDLIGKSLLICTSDETQGEIVGVHSLLREMAWKIVNEEKRIEERSRLKDPYAVHNLLTSGEGRRATHGIHLDLSKSEDMHLKSNAFRGMESLKWLDFYSPKTIGYENKVQLSDGGELNYLPNELRGLNWDHFPFNSLPVGFSPRKLVYLAITHSPIHKCWELAQKLEYLVLLCLSNCENLTSVPNLSGCSNLEYLLLRQCKNLIELPSDIQFLDKLETLEATNCQSLKSIPPKLNSNFLKLLLLSNCPKLTFCPEVNNSAKLQALDLDGTPINNLPNSIYNVINGGHIKLYGPNITNFPKISKKLELLRLRQTAIREIKIDDSKFNRFHLIENALLTALPTNIWDMVSDELVVQDCPLIGSFPVISNPASHSLTTLRVKNCKRVTEFPSCICKLSCLEVVVFVGTGIRSEPTCIKELRRLPYLDLSYNASMESIPSTINELAKLTVSKQKLDVNVVMKVNSHGSSLPALVSTSNSKHNSQDLKQLHHNYPQLIGNSLVLAKLPHRHSSRLSKVSQLLLIFF